jgi:hypothetical protein
LPQGIKKNDMELQSYIPSNGNGHIWDEMIRDISCY